MTEATARNAVLVGGVVCAIAVTAGAASRGSLPQPRRLLATGIVFVALAALADTNPRLAGPATGLVTVAVVLANGTEALDGITKAVTSAGKLGSGSIPRRGAPEVPSASGGAAGGAAAAVTGGAPPAAAPGGSSGAITTAGGARGIVDQAAALARRVGGAGVGVVSGYRPGSTTSSGNRSDHASNDENQAARDIAADGINALTGPPSPKLDAAAAAIGRAFGRNYGDGRRTIIDTFQWRGYRVQVLWRTPLYGGHMGHIHLGVHKG